MYTPTEYGGYGGAGGGSQTDLRCTYADEQAGGEGGMYWIPEYLISVF